MFTFSLYQIAESKWSDLNANPTIETFSWVDFCSIVWTDSRIVVSSSSNNNCKTSVCPFRAARWKHVSPFELHRSNSAPYSWKIWMASNSMGLLYSPAHFECIGVLPS